LYPAPAPYPKKKGLGETNIGVKFPRTGVTVLLIFSSKDHSRGVARNLIWVGINVN